MCLRIDDYLARKQLPVIAYGAVCLALADVIARVGFGHRVRRWKEPGLCLWRIGYRRVMPRISAFYGIVIYMYWNEKDHPVAHFHAYHAGRRASVSMDGEVLAGRLEPRALQVVREWAKLRQDEILANWERARRNEPLHGIEPLS